MPSDPHWGLLQVSDAGIAGVLRPSESMTCTPKSEQFQQKAALILDRSFALAEQ